jgi:hypothetical protein
MKTIAPILLTILICLCHYSYAQTIKTTHYYSKAKVKKTLLIIEEFDKNGNFIKETECQDNKCSKVDVKVNIYDDNGQLVEDSIYTNNWGYHQLIWRKKYTYYNNGNLKTEKKVNEICPDGYDDLNTYHYDSTGKLIKIYYQYKCYNEDYFDYPIYFKYDSSGNLVEKLAKYVDTTKVFYKKVYQYDNKNNLISDTYFYHNNDSLELSSIKEYKYDSLNRKTQKKWSYSETNSDSVGYTYYSNGLLKSKIDFPKHSDDWLSWEDLSYDKKNNLIEKQLYYITNGNRKRKGAKRLIEYEYYEK